MCVWLCTSRLHFLTVIETTSALAVLQTDVFGCEQLLQAHYLESLNRRWEPADPVTFDDSVFLLGIVDLLAKLVIIKLVISVLF